MKHDGWMILYKTLATAFALPQSHVLSCATLSLLAAPWRVRPLSIEPLPPLELMSDTARASLKLIVGPQAPW